MVSFRLGQYPGVVYDARGKDRVVGEIYKIRDQNALLRLLDKYEGLEYQRLLVDVYVDDSPVLIAWCYTISDKQAEALRRIPSNTYFPHGPDSTSSGRLA